MSRGSISALPALGLIALRSRGSQGCTHVEQQVHPGERTVDDPRVASLPSEQERPRATFAPSLTNSPETLDST